MPEDFDEQAVRGLLRVNNQPLQRANGITLLRTSTVGGPDREGDRRIYLDTTTLARLLEVARSSTTGRVQVDRAGVRVDLYQHPDRHTFEVWTLIGADPRPEPLPAALRNMPGVT